MAQSDGLKMKIFAKIRFYYGAATISFIAAGIMVPLMMIFPQKRSNILHYWNKVIIFFLGGKIVSHGKRDNTVDMFIANHQGIIDIVSLEAAANTDIRWVAKKQLFDAPWFGYLLKLPNMIEVNRENKTGLVKLLRDAKETLESEVKRVIAIFPEGTRTDKQALLEFKGGTRVMAEKLELTIQPIVISNSKKLLNEHNRTARNATVHLTYLEPFKVSKANKGWYADLRTTMQECIDTQYNEYKRER
ncbi:MAG: 1-acyl-sn-glycerol-3-phosphate acyltransferase (EC [uncultured Sulfurovum sp.]|uniref:1-acyl-sn-glycerol-3-phosphate acyltransferase (EC) n=1 Tax=uncultured Sulfurovum sp. TaxID=269237 RepID=A0A6S6SWG4_9BACT|nr:MAG: 1-acyl-sn-glycerol-3-phosphate acyltransferase (EC [uncultured Sulfurovum sp.]